MSHRHLLKKRSAVPKHPREHHFLLSLHSLILHYISNFHNKHKKKGTHRSDLPFYVAPHTNHPASVSHEPQKGLPPTPARRALVISVPSSRMGPVATSCEAKGDTIAICSPAQGVERPR